MLRMAVGRPSMPMKTLMAVTPIVMMGTTRACARSGVPVISRTMPRIRIQALHTSRIVWTEVKNAHHVPSPTSDAPVPLWQKARIAAVREWHHFKNGCKLLWANTKIARGFAVKALNGQALNRHERNMLLRTAADLFRIVPMMVFVVVPFAEFALPFFLWIFPNLLPSTFQDKHKEEEKAKKLVKAKLEFAKFLQETMSQMNLDLKTKDKYKDEDGALVEEFKTFMEKVRKGDYVSNEEILHFSKMFQDEFTLDNLPRPQLLALCKYMGISTMGTNTFLRYMLRSRLQKLKKDDEVIAAEGVEALDLEELQEACIARGMRGLGVSQEKLAAQLSQWLELSLKQGIPSSLLILSRAFLITARISPEKALQKTLSDMSPNLVQEAVTRAEEGTAENKAELREARADAAAEASRELTTSAKKKPVGAKDSIQQSEKLEDLAEAVATMSASTGSSLAPERQMLQEVKAIDRVIEEEAITTHSATLARMEKRVNALIEDVEEDLVKAEKRLGDKMKVIDADRDGFISPSELAEAVKQMKHPLTPEQLNELFAKVDKDKDGKVSIAELGGYLHDEAAILESLAAKSKKP